MPKMRDRGDSVLDVGVTEDEPDRDLLLAAIRENSFKPVVAMNQTTGLQLAQLRHATGVASGTVGIAEEFLAGSRLAPGDFEVPGSILKYFDDSSQVMLAQGGQRAVPAEGSVELPPPVRLPLDVGTALRKRRSRREYTGDPITLPQLSTLLWAAAGVTGKVLSELTSGSVATISCRTAASGGGLFPIDVYVVGLRVTGLDPDVYLYSPPRHGLLPCDADVGEVLEGLHLPDDQISGRELAAAFLFVGSPWKSMRKYGARGVRYMFIEAGAMSQGLHLARTALELGGVDYGGFYDSATNRALGLDGRYETVVHAVVCGVE
ncbi:MAG TPA: SagB family peptide dehydrogenase [Actinomycetota bacterium]|nr:SagB family peptide dehydrogenase [Actinomycetota bacterium]